ncbi:MAG: Clp protease N-terminal domain-containing protein, partial [Algoriella sp.]
MDFNQFTIKGREAIQSAQQIAVEHKNQAIEPAHIFGGMLDVDENVISLILEKQGVKIDLLKPELDLEINKYPKIEGQQGNHLSNSSNQILQVAKEIAKEMNDDFITLEHLLLGLIKNVSPVSQLLKNKGVTFDNTKKLVTELRNGERVTSENAEGTYNSLNKFAKNLTDLAKEGKLDPVIGRDEEIRRVLQILSRRTKNNPILIGEPGVGKTAIAEG